MIRYPDEPVYRTCEDALDDDGYVLTLEGATTAGNVKKCTAGDTPYGVAITSTIDPITGVAASGKKVAIQTSGVCYVKLKATNAQIAAGDPVGTAAGGTVDKIVLNTSSVATLLAGLKMIVGIAEEAKSANSGGKIKVRLCLPALGP